MAELSSSSSFLSSIHLSWFDHFTGKSASLSLGTDGNPPSPEEIRAHIMRPLQLMKTAACFFARRYAGKQHRREQPLPPLTFTSAEYPPLVPVRAMFGCVAAACHRLSFAPGDKRVLGGPRWRWAGCVMERVTRGRVGKVQVRRLRRVLRAFCIFMRAAANTGWFSGVLTAAPCSSPVNHGRRLFHAWSSGCCFYPPCTRNKHVDRHQERLVHTGVLPPRCACRLRQHDGLDFKDSTALGCFLWPS